MTRIFEAVEPILDLRKLEDYCLNPAHPRGRHKARVFRDALGIGKAEAAWLRKTLLAGALSCEATPIGDDSFGARWRADITVSRQSRTVVVRTLWIVRAHETVPRFVTCWVL